MQISKTERAPFILAFLAIIFRVRRSRGEMYSGQWSRPSVCLSVPRRISTLLHVPDVSWGNGRGYLIVVHYWAGL